MQTSFDTYTFDKTARIEAIGKDEYGTYFTVDSTIFYPQGGGQPSDKGEIILPFEKFQVKKVRKIDQEIRHYVEEHPFSVGQEVILQIDPDLRLLHARLHSGGHLLSHIIEEMHPELKAVKGHHFPGECYVEFKFEKEPVISLNMINQSLLQAIKDNHLIHVKNEGERYIHIGPYSPYRCLGTHVRSTSEIGPQKATKAKASKNSLKISYQPD